LCAGTLNLQIENVGKTEAPVRAGPGVLGGAGSCLVSSDGRKAFAEEMERLKERCAMHRASDTVGSAEPRSRTDLAGRVEAIPLETVPFDHLYLQHMFSPDEYRRLLDHLPETRRYRELTHREAVQPDGTSARRKFYLLPEHVRWLPAEQRAYWRELSRHLRSRGLQKAFKSKFRAALEQRFGTSIDKLSFYPVPMLLRDLGGYRIGIHGDGQRKAITVQFYLPRDESQAHLGTLFHEGRNGEAAQRTKRLAFVPGAGYAFPVIRHQSWHSVPQTADSDGERNSLMLTYYVQQGPLAWLAQRIHRLAVFIGYGLRK
jgi:hypothetical protein